MSGSPTSQAHPPAAAPVPAAAAAPAPDPSPAPVAAAPAAAGAHATGALATATDAAAPALARPPPQRLQRSVRFPPRPAIKVTALELPLHAPVCGGGNMCVIGWGREGYVLVIV